MTDGLRLLISSTPLWQQSPHPLPVHVETVYMVMGKRDNLWQTVISSTTEMSRARMALDKAYKTGKFERFAISEGQSVNKAPAVRWKTIETVLYTPTAFEKIMNRIREKTANGNPPKLSKDAYLVGHKQSQNFLLGLACILAYFNQSPFALTLVAILAVCEVFFMMDDYPLNQEKAKFFNNTRNWAFATLNGVLLLTLLLA